MRQQSPERRAERGNVALNRIFGIAQQVRPMAMRHRVLVQFDL
jgi:hypothetical protein